jgi:hypothetical protein
MIWRRERRGSPCAACRAHPLIYTLPHHPLESTQLEPPLPLELARLTHRTKTSRAELLLGGGPPVVTATAEAITGIEASPEAALTVAMYRPNRAAVARSPSTIFCRRK